MNKHGKTRLTFAELSFAGQSRSLNGAVRHIERAVLAHLRRAVERGKDPVIALNRCIAVLSRLIGRLQQHAIALHAQSHRNTTVQR